MVASINILSYLILWEYNVGLCWCAVWRHYACRLCRDHGIQYLTFRFWIGMWLSLLLLLMVAFDLSALVRYITRFTEESFAILIALIYIFEAFKKLIRILDDDPVNLHPDMPLDDNCTCLPPALNQDNSSLSMTTLTSLGSCCSHFHAMSSPGTDTLFLFSLSLIIHVVPQHSCGCMVWNCANLVGDQLIIDNAFYIK